MATVPGQSWAACSVMPQLLMMVKMKPSLNRSRKASKRPRRAHATMKNKGYRLAHPLLGRYSRDGRSFSQQPSFDSFHCASLRLFLRRLRSQRRAGGDAAMKKPIHPLDVSSFCSWHGLQRPLLPTE